MRVFIAGATGVLGRNLIPLLLGQGHSVRALVRDVAKARELFKDKNVELEEGDLLNPGSQLRLPELLDKCEAVMHLATVIPRDFTAHQAWDQNTRLRTEGTSRLVEAALAASVTIYIQQSIIMAYPDGGEEWLDEEIQLDTSPDRAATSSPVIKMEELVRAVPTERLKWSILRGGTFVGPGTFQENLIERLKAGTEEVAGDGRNFNSFIHVIDMARACAAVIEQVPGGLIANIVAPPVRQGEYLDKLARLSGALPPPRNPDLPRLPSWRCRNDRAKMLLGWQPIHSLFPESIEAG